MTMVITPEIPRAKDAQDVGFRWVSFTRASPPKVGQFWMRANSPTDGSPARPVPGQCAGPAAAVFLRHVGFSGRGELLVSKLPDERQQEAMAALKAIAGKV
ncbi:hypothetical protein, partial [Stenotrophomonas maltophilia group sp. Smal12]|uniref:hypothetical protein n=1 Tax=Stenotrophomonas maltophilia group sp. Smal12 TaxID=3050414 RepID=UPI00300E93D7